MISGDTSRRLTHTERGQHVTRVKKKLQRRPIDHQTGTRRERERGVRKIRR